MANEQPLIDLLLQRKLLRRDQLRECVERQERDRKRGRETSLGDILVKKGYLNVEQLTSLRREIEPVADDSMLDNGLLEPATTTKQPDMADTVLHNDLTVRYSSDDEPADGDVTASVPAPASTVIQLNRFCRYELRKELGRGGMGVVYAAYDPQLRREVALKIIGQSVQGERERARFEREASLMAKLNHAHIVKIFDIGEQQGRYFFTMELIDGTSMEKLLESGASVPQSIQILNKAAQAVHYAHQQGIIHRDIKPSNIMVTRDMEPKVMDFGLAKEVSKASRQLSKSQEIVGTPGYMSPEQVQGYTREVDAQTDVYALGVVLYQIITGRVPFTSSNPMNLLYQIIYVEPVAPSKLSPAVSRDLEAICLKALEKQKSKRYASALQLARDLQNYLEGRPVSAKPVTPWVRMQKWVRRHRLAAVAGVIALLTIISATLFTMYKLKQGKDIAEQRERAVSLRSTMETLRRAETLLVVSKNALDKYNYILAFDHKRQADDLIASVRKAADTPQNAEEEPQCRQIAVFTDFLAATSAGMQDYVMSPFSFAVQDGGKQSLSIQSTPMDELATALGEQEKLSYISAIQPSPKLCAFAVRLQDKKTVKLYLRDIVAGRTVKTLPFPVGQVPCQVAFGNNDELLAVGSLEGRLWVWDLRRDKMLSGEDGEKIDDGWTRFLQFSNDNAWLCAGSKSRLELRSLPDLKVHAYWPVKPKGQLAAFSGDSKWLLVCNAGIADKLLMLPLDTSPKGVEIGTTRQQIKYQIKQIVHSVCFAAQDRFIAVGSKNDILFLRNNAFGDATDDTNFVLLGAHDGEVRKMVANADGSLLFSLGQDSRLICWNTYNFHKIFETTMPGNIGLHSAYMGEPSLFVANDSDSITFFNHSHVSRLNHRAGSMHKLVLAKRHDLQADGNHIKNMLKLSRMDLVRTQGGVGVSIALSDDARYLAYSLGYFLLLWDIPNDMLSLVQKNFEALQLQSLAFSGDSSLLLWRRWDLCSLWQLPAKNKLSVLDSVKSKHMLMHPQKRQIFFYQIATGQICSLTWHDGQIQNRVEISLPCHSMSGMFFDASGTRLAVDYKKYSSEGLEGPEVVQVWDIGKSPAALQNTVVPPMAIGSVCFSERNCLALGGANGEFQVLDLDRAQQPLYTHMFNDPIQRLWYDARRKIYWIHTKDRLFLYPHVPEVAGLDNADEHVKLLYPLPVLQGLPILQATVSADFRRVAAVMQSGEVWVYDFPGKE